MILFDSRGVTVYHFPMRYAAIVLLLLLSAAPAWAVTDITILPFTCSTAGETYVVSSNLTLNSGDAITVTADNVIINGNGKTVTYAVTGAGYGVLINTTVTSIEIYNLTLTQGGYDPLAGERVHGIYRNGNISGVKLHDNTISIAKTGAVANAYGYAINLANLVNNSIGNSIYSNTINVTGVSGGRGISVEISGAGKFSGSMYGNTITISNLTSVPASYPRAISLGNGSASAGVSIYSNTVTVDSGSSIAQGISLWASDNNIIRSNTVNLAGLNSRAILIDGASDSNEIYLNTVNLTSANGASEHSAGVRIRYGSSNNKVYRNIITATPASANCFPIRHGGYSVAEGTPTGNVFHHNTLSGGSNVIYIEGGSANTRFYGNTIANTGGGNAINVYGATGDYSDDLAFSYETITGPATVRFAGMAGQPTSTNFVFCQSGITLANVTEGPGVHGYTITTSNCPSNPPLNPGGLTVQ